LEYGCEVFALQQFAVSFFSAVQFLQHVAFFDLVVLIRPLSGLESGFEVFFALLQFAVSSFVLFSFCNMLILLMWLFCLGLYEVSFSLLEKACL
jgi:hypothetical protein